MLNFHRRASDTQSMHRLHVALLTHELSQLHCNAHMLADT